MKILLTVEFYNPDKGGAQKVVEDLAIGLVKKGHDVTVATTHIPERKRNVIDGVKIESFKIGGNAVNGIKGDKKEIKRYEDLITRGGFDVILNYAAQSWHTDLTLPLLEEINAVKILVPVGYSRFKSPKYKMYFNRLPAYLKRYDKLVYHSPIYQDKIYGDENDLSEKAVIIHNGALKREFGGDAKIDVRKKLGIKTRYLIVTISHHNFAKGHRFVIGAFKKMKRSDSTLVIIGDKFTSRGVRKLAHFFLDYTYCFISSLLNKNIKLASGDDRNFVVSAYKSADLHMSGSLFECAPLVMYESFASGTPFVTTDVGNVREHEKYLRVANSPVDMAVAANEILDNEDIRKSLQVSALELWDRDHAVENLINEYENLFEELHESHI